MKKFTLAALLCAMLLPSAAKAQEVTYVEDPAQGYTFNKFSDNWFIQLEGGANLLMTPCDTKEKFAKRIQPQVELNIGKWFSPIIGLRTSFGFARYKGAADATSIYMQNTPACGDNTFNHEVFYKFNFGGDVLLNLTNWWCGYKPNRVYNASLYGGVMVNVPYADQDGLKKIAPKNMGVRVGVLNSFAVSKRVDLLLDIRYGADQMHSERNTMSQSLAALVGVTYKFKKSEWKAPIVPVCPTYKYTDAEGDALVARLQAADAKIASLEKQLRDCMDSKPAETKAAEADAPLATIYFPIGSAKVQGVQGKVAKAVANAMKGTDDNYTVKGWADNYTGSAKVNDRLRNARANNVKKILVKNGVKADRLETATGDGNLTNYGAKCASLDRAVTINVK